jgi:hypothetical protein
MANARTAMWKYVPLASGLVLFVITALTTGVGIFLTPVAAALTVLAFRRVGLDSVPVKLGFVINVLFALLFLLAIGSLVVHLISN